MFAQNGFAQNAMGSLQTPFQVYFSSLDAMTKGMGPMKGIARAQLEIMGLMSRRAQAYMEFPSRLSRCRAPQEMFEEQMRFWQTALQQYQESSEKIMAAWSQSMAASFTSATMASATASKPARERDYIAFPEAARQANGSKPPASSRPRNVA